jgi:GNAT superfamily N-acetyltransferase
MRRAPPVALAVHAATPERWPDVAALFGRNGACGGCWCQFWRQTQAEYRAGKGAPNRRALRRQVLAGEVPGLLAYAGDEPVGWVAVAPRAAYARLARARNLVAVDDAPVWSAPCFFVKRGWRGRGVAGRLLAAAAERARAAGAPFLEGYPVDSQAELGDAFVYTGAYSTFVRLGFTEVARKARTRPVMRLRT